MEKSTASRELNKLWTGMHQHLNNFMDTRDQEELHQFRVQIKKLKSLLLMLDEATGKKAITPHFKPVKKIFRHAGTIRDAHMHLEQAKQFQLNETEFERKQNDLMEAETEKFTRRRKKYGKKISKTHRKLKKKMHYIAGEQVLEFFVQQLNLATLTLAKKDFSDEMHAARKAIKHLIYNRKTAKGALGNKLELDYDYLDDLQHLIGDWHDAILAHQILQENQLNAPGELKRLESQIRVLQDEIVTKGADFWSKAVRSLKPTNISEEKPPGKSEKIFRIEK